jgi:tRNA/tmRNA/rRNA uracil-C5-methylase (TrmA/RlmC/RlmD family)
MHTNPFATEAAQYAHLRPTYPESLFTFFSTTVASREVAWDCATGNGQAATHLARYFGRVIATDESAEMIAQAPRSEDRISGRRGRGFAYRGSLCGLGDGSFCYPLV